MADTALQERLRESSKVFDGLLSLIPAKLYYGDDGESEHWKKGKKKLSKDAVKAARRARLDPDSERNRNAKQVMEERARNKRKLQDMQREDGEDEHGPEQENDANDDDDDDDADEDEERAEDRQEEDDDVQGVEKEKPGEGLKKHKAEGKANKKQKKTAKDVDAAEESGAVDEKTQAAAPDKTEKLSHREEKKQLKKQKKEEKKAEKTVTKGDKAAEEALATAAEEALPPSTSKQQKKKKEKSKAAPEPPQTAADDARAGAEIKASGEVDEASDAEDAEMQPTDMSGLLSSKDGADASSPDSSPRSPTFDMDTDDGGAAKRISAEPASTTTSVSSMAGPGSEKSKAIKIPADTTALRERLAARIEQLRAARKADGTNGRPPRTREELLESRRAKQAQRKVHKKELRKQAKVEEERRREEALAGARTSPGSIMSPMLSLGGEGEGEGEGAAASAGAEPEAANHFAFGRIAFADGAQMSHDLSYVKEKDGKKKGPSDAKTALLRLEAQKKRIDGLDTDKRKEVLEKEAWLAARRRAEGDKVHDDEALLRKTVKRKDKAKKRSEKAWKERTEGVDKSIRDRQRKREDNLRARRDDKVLRKMGHKKKRSAPAGGRKKKKPSRPGFEGGSF